jgi:hypothetical protein
MKNLIRSLFDRLADEPSSGVGTARAPCGATAALAVEHVVDQISGRLRAAPGYAKVLRGPVETTLRYIDEVAEQVPGPLTCSRAAFGSDSEVNAFFVSTTHLQEVFSRSPEVRQVFDAHPDALECWALLCMQTKERQRFGTALVRDQVQGDVMQTTLSFRDHQVIAPGPSEPDARQALKCCMFSGCLGHLRRRLDEATERRDKVQVLRQRLSRLGTKPDTEGRRAELKRQIEDAEREMSSQDPPIADISDRLRFVAQALANPSELLHATRKQIHLSRLGIQIDEGSDESGHRLVLSEIRVVSHAPRIGALVRFPRTDLLPQIDFVGQADLFLSQSAP